MKRVLLGFSLLAGFACDFDAAYEAWCAEDPACSGAGGTGGAGGATEVPGCETSADCSNPTHPRCDLSLQTCAGCVDHDDCADRTDGLTACTSSGSCALP